MDRPAAGVPERPQSDSPLESLRQGLLYIRQNPTEREDERIQRFLWLDQWAKLLQDNGRMTSGLGTEFSQDLTNFVQNPPLSRRSLERIVSRAETRLGRNVAYYQLYLTGLRTGAVQDGMRWLEFVEPDGVTDLAERARELLDMRQVGELRASRKIGVLLPLSGDLASFGEEVFTAIQIVSELDYTRGVEFVVHDTGASDAQLLEAFQRLVLDESVTALIGPLSNRASEYVFERSQIMRVPTISLAPREDLNFFGNYNFRSTLTLTDQIRSLGAFLRRQLRVSRIGVLFPDSSYGWDAAKIAQEEFPKFGLQVTEVGIYPEGATDFKEPLQKMLRLDLPRARSHELCREEDPRPNCVRSLDELPPIYNFEVLFVPDQADTVGLLMPTLPFLRVYGLQVVGLSSLHDSRLIERGQNHAEGVIFTESFVASERTVPTRFFVESFRRKTNREPSRLAAEAFDVALMLADQMLQEGRGALDREAMTQSIRRLRAFEGLTGDLYSVENEIRRQPRFMVVRDGSFQLIR